MLLFTLMAFKNTDLLKDRPKFSHKIRLSLPKVNGVLKKAWIFTTGTEDVLMDEFIKYKLLIKDQQFDREAGT